MNVGRPYSDVLEGARGQLLATLVALEQPVTIRELARHAEVSPQSALDHVNALNRAGLVVTQRAGRSILVSLNRAHLAAEPIVALVALRGRLVERLDGELVFWPELAAAWLFGSAARGDGGIDSDIDMLVVAESTTDRVDWIDAGAQLRERVRSWTGNELQLVEHTRRSFAALVASENPLIAELRRDGIPLTPQSRRFLARAS